MVWKLLAFDWDGTLVDTMEVMYQATRTVFIHYELKPPTREVYLEEITIKNMDEFYHDHGVPRQATRQDLNAIWRMYFNDPGNYDAMRLRDGAREALLICRAMGINTALVSGTIRDVIMVGLSRFGLPGFIDHVGADASDKVGELKRTLDRFVISPEEAAYVDDTFEGLSAAKRVGMTAIGITGGFSPRQLLLEADPDLMIDSLIELLPLLKAGKAEA